MSSGEAARLAADLDLDIRGGKIVFQIIDAATEQSFSYVLDRCYGNLPPIFLRTNDALHLACAIVANESNFVSADARQRAAASLLGFTVLPQEGNLSA